mmetsp:Transcript_23585/g.36784  ORF Transcript_23585/g.36784 Transcript_23585/m.36784 type:complete len:106 (-) Transcript_23585:15-332(-)
MPGAAQEDPDDVYERVFGRHAFKELIDTPIECLCSSSTSPPPFAKRKPGVSVEAEGPDAYETDEEYLDNLRLKYFVNSLDHMYTEKDEIIQSIMSEGMKDVSLEK